MGEAAGVEFVAEKHSSLWGTTYQRLVRIAEGDLFTLDPADWRETNRWLLSDVLAVEREGNRVVVQILGSNSTRRSLAAALHPVNKAVIISQALSPDWCYGWRRSVGLDAYTA